MNWRQVYATGTVAWQPMQQYPSASHRMPTRISNDEDFGWIERMTDEQCMEVFWLYLDPPEPFLTQHSPRLLGMAMRRALQEIARAQALHTSEPTAPLVP